MSENPIFVTFPTNGTQIVGIGITTVDYLLGKVLLPNGIVMSLVRRIPKEYPLHSIYIDVGDDVNIEVLRGNEIQFAGLIRRGITRIPNITHDQLRVISTKETDIFTVSSTSTAGLEGSTGQPSNIFGGVNETIGVNAAKLTETSTPIYSIAVLKVRSLNAAATYIAVGNENDQEFRLVRVGDTLDVDFVNDLSKVYVIADAGADNAIEWIGG